MGEKWTEVEVQQNEGKHTVSGLVANTGYVVQGRLQSVETRVWSDFSGSVAFKTAVRSSPVFEWDPAKKHPSLVLSNGNKTATPPARTGSYHCVLSKLRLSAETMASVQWELTLRKCDSRGNGYLYFWSGFIEAAHYDSTKFDSQYGGSSNGYRAHVLYVYG